MNFTLMSIFPWISFVVPLGFLGGLIGGFISGITGGAKKVKAAKSSFAKQLAAQKKMFAQQLNLQAQESKKTLLYVGVGAVALIIVMFIVLKK